MRARVLVSDAGTPGIISGSLSPRGFKQPQARHFMLSTAHAAPYLASVSFPPTLPYTCVLRLHTVATPRTTRRPNELDNDISSQSGPLVACLLFSSQLSFSGTPLVSGVRASRACMGTPGRPAAPHYRARANGIHYGTCLLYTSPSPRDRTRSRMPSSA